MTSTIIVYEVADPNKSVVFPVTPLPEVSDASVKLNWSVAQRGGISRPRGRQERTYSFKAYLPGNQDSGQPYWSPNAAQASTLGDPDLIIDQLREWHAPVAKQGAKLHLIIDRVDNIRDEIVYVDTIKTAPDNRGGYQLDLTFTEWRAILVRLDAEQDGSNPPPTDPGADSQLTSPAPPDTPDQYAVQDGDTLYDIAATQLGDGARWQEIYDMNSDIIGGDPDLIIPGQVLQLPSSSPGQADTSDPDPNT